MPGDEPGKGGKRLFPKGSSLVKPVSKNQRTPIMVMSAVVCCMLVSFAWYQFAVMPAHREMEEAKKKEQATQKQLADLQAAQQKQQAELLKQQAAARAILILDSKPTGANVIIGSFQKQTPASFDSLIPGKVSILVQLDGYEDYKQDVNVTIDKPTDLGTIALVQKKGNLSLTCAQSDVTYNLTGPENFTHDGKLPDKFQNLPVGDYQLTVQMHDWKLAPIVITIHDRENVEKEIKFPFASAVINTVPSGATVRDKRTVLGKTPLSLSQLRPGTLNLSVDLPPYTMQRFTVTLPEFGNVTQTVTLQKDRDFIAACGMTMIWIPDGGYWAAKYEMPQGEFENVVGFNPSTFRRPNRPVETISWETAMAFCVKLTEYERKAGKLPSGYHYSLPTESQWSTFSADADINLAAMSRTTSLASTQDVGASEPNKYGLYDTIGNVWEWCTDAFDDKGNHSMRGGGWLSSAENFLSADTRIGAPPKYADRFTGFRVVLVPD